jgi:Fur family zinc uptake transcriptional regulator
MKILTEAEKHCKDYGHRFTDPRCRVLEIIARTGKPVGAYDIISAMPTGTNPPTVYRALEFWEQQGFVHRISSLNLYAACHAEHRHEGSQYMVCGDCGRIEEVHLCHLPGTMQRKIDETGFKLARWNTELHGSCRDCQPRNVALTKIM